MVLMHLCRVRKLFRQDLTLDMTKLSNKKIKYIINQITKKNQNTKTIAEIYDITRRRVQQLVEQYKKTGEVPKLKKNRRPRTYLTKGEKEIIDRVWN